MKHVLFIILITVLITLSSMFVHESGHFLSGVLLGYEMSFSLLRVEFTNKAIVPISSQNIVVIAGLIFSGIQLLIGVILYKNNEHLISFILVASVLVCRIMTIVSTLMIGRIQDEDKISIMLGFPSQLVPVLAVFIYLWFFHLSNRIQPVGFKNLAIIISSSLLTIVVVGVAHGF